MTPNNTESEFESSRWVMSKTRPRLGERNFKQKTSPKLQKQRLLPKKTSSESACLRKIGLTLQCFRHFQQLSIAKCAVFSSFAPANVSHSAQKCLQTHGPVLTGTVTLFEAVLTEVSGRVACCIFSTAQLRGTGAFIDPEIPNSKLGIRV